MHKWDFPGGVGLDPEGSNSASIETFLSNIPQSLAREVIQNSMDAHDWERAEQVRVEFSFSKMPSHRILGYDQLLHDIAPKAIRFWGEKSSVDTIAFVEKFKSVLQEPMVDVLRISDFNTIGLLSTKFNALISGRGYSVKDSISSAGSKGIGKAAPFAASDLRMVFYDSMTKYGDRINAGVVNFVSFYNQEGDKIITTQPNGKMHDADSLLPIDFESGYKRNVPGTDLYIVGLKNLENWKERIILSIINNFLVSIYEGLLIVAIDGMMIDQSTLPHVLKDITEKMEQGTFDCSGELDKEDKEYRQQFQNTLTYYEVLEGGEKINLPEDIVNKYDFIQSPEDAYLKLKLVENATRRVLQTRKTGMSIYERNRISGAVMFSGVFQALGDELNQVLKTMENPAHDAWDCDRISDKRERKIRKDLLKDLYDWYKANVKAYEENIADEIDAIGMNELLPLEDPVDDGNSNTDSGIRFTVKTVQSKTLKQRTKDTNEKQAERRTKKIVDTTGDGTEGDDEVPHYNPDTLPENEENKPNGGDRDDLGTLLPKKDGEGNDPVYTFSEVDNPSFLKYKIIGNPNKPGLYRLVGKSSYNKDKIALSFGGVGDNSVVYDQNLVEVTSPSHKVTKQGKRLIIHQVQKGETFTVFFQLPLKFQTRMKGTVYEVKG